MPEKNLSQTEYAPTPPTAKATRTPAKRIDFVSLKLVRESTITYPKRTIRCAADADELLRPLMESRDREVFVALHLSVKHEPLALIVCSIGSLDSSIVHPRDVLKAACVSNASAVLCAHNHPSGDPTPSPEDLSVTRRLDESCRILGIDFLDHIIIGSDGRLTSLREQGWK